MVQSHRCPATVSGTKSADTTEASYLGKAQRVGMCREPGNRLGFRLGSLSRGRAPVAELWCLPPTLRGWDFFCLLSAVARLPRTGLLQWPPRIGVASTYQR